MNIKHNIEEEDEDCYPKTLFEAVENFMVFNLSDSDDEVISHCPPERLDWLLSNFEKTIVGSCGLNMGNYTLIEVCCPDKLNATPHDAARVIMEAIRVYFQTGIMPQRRS